MIETLLTLGFTGLIFYVLIVKPIRDNRRQALGLPGADNPPTLPDGALSYGAWLRRVNHEPNKAPHLLVTGPTGSGKTTLVTALLADRPGALVVVTPKPAHEDAWAGADVTRLDSSLSVAPLAATIRSVYDEMTRRYSDSAASGWLTLVVDEYPWIASESVEAKAQILNMLALSRSARIRLVLIGTESNVKALHLEGRGEARGNALWLRLSRDRTATLGAFGEDGQAIDIAPAHTAAQRASLRGRTWLHTVTHTHTHTHTPQQDAQNAAPVRVCAPGSMRDLVAYLVDQGWSVSQIRDRIKGDYKIIGQMVKEVQEDND